ALVDGEVDRQEDGVLRRLASRDAQRHTGADSVLPRLVGRGGDDGPLAGVTAATDDDRPSRQLGAAPHLDGGEELVQVPVQPPGTSGRAHSRSLAGSGRPVMRLIRNLTITIITTYGSGSPRGASDPSPARGVHRSCPCSAGVPPLRSGLSPSLSPLPRAAAQNPVPTTPRRRARAPRTRPTNPRVKSPAARRSKSPRSTRASS